MKNYVSILSLFLFATCGRANTEKPLLVTGLAPVANLISIVAGSEFEVTNIMSAQADPHLFQLKPSQAQLIVQADLVLPLNELDRGIALDQVQEKTIFLAQSDKNYDSVEEHMHHDIHEGHDHSNHGTELHIWLSFKESQKLAHEISHILSKQYPNKADFFEDNASKWVDKNQKIFDFLKEKKEENRYIIERHPAWGYLVNELGLSMLGELQLYEGEQSSLKELESWIAKIRALDNQAIIIDDAFSKDSSLINVLLKETTAQRIVLNPLGDINDTSDLLTILSNSSLALISDHDKDSGE